MAIKPVFLGVFLGLLVAPLAQAAEPLSAIDWLSDSVVEDQLTVPDAPDAPGARQPDVIRVLPLDAVVPDSAGLIDASVLGLPADIWGRSSAGDLARALARVEDTPEAPPALRAFLLDLIRARFDPPIDAVIDNRFFLARVDRLLSHGHLEDATRLIGATNEVSTELFRRTFDIALLQGTETDACRIIDTTPDLSPTYPTRIFCLARLGKWDVAALTLGNAETLGILSDEEDALLLQFLDPELFEGEPLPPAPRTPTPLLFRLYEAVGERIPTGPLPLAFAVTDLSETVGWKARLRAAERLTAAQAMSFEAMLDVFSERKAAASGGIWERVDALQALMKAVDREDARAIGQALPAAMSAAQQAGLEGALSHWLAPKLTVFPDRMPSAHLVFEIALISGDAQLAATHSSSSEMDQFLLSLARGAPLRPPAEPLSRAVARGLSAFGPGPAYAALIDDDRSGEALLRALAQLADGAEGNPNATANSLALLRSLGLETLARQIAVELILKEGAA